LAVSQRSIGTRIRSEQREEARDHRVGPVSGEGRLSPPHRLPVAPRVGDVRGDDRIDPVAVVRDYSGAKARSGLRVSNHQLAGGDRLRNRTPEALAPERAGEIDKVVYAREKVVDRQRPERVQFPVRGQRLAALQKRVRTQKRAAFCRGRELACKVG
jgi:hypothetical protein